MFNCPKFTQLVLLLFTFSFCANSYAQDFVEPCASTQVNNSIIEQDSRYARSYMYLEHKIVQYMHSPPSERSDDIYTLPVVVHVVHLGEPVGIGTNISDAQVQSAIDAMNDDFRKIAGTAGDGDGVDTNIEFCLAARDPDGNSTTGIVRVDGSSVANYEEMGIEASSGNGASEEDIKALSTWPRTEYVNIWIVNEIENNDAGGGIQGYAYFPVDSPVDGIVVLYNAFGTVGNLKVTTDLNRTITHEMGHYLALYHTFHSTNDCDPESNCEAQGDKVCDTPVTILNASCNSPVCPDQQVENYMDYTSESCKDMFTQGQKDRMRATLETERASLLESLGCSPVSDYDAGITAVIYPTGSVCDNSFQPVINLTNFGANTLTEATINYGIDGITNNTYEWSGSLATGATLELTLPLISSGSGDHTLDVEVVDPNGQSDEYNDNNSSFSEYGIGNGEPIVLEVTLDFFGTETTWEVINDTGGIIATGGPYIDNNQGLIMTEYICAPSGCYDLIVYDEWGDGMSFTNGSYLLSNADGAELASGGGDFGDFEINNFCFTEIESEGSSPVASFSMSDPTICEGSNIDFMDGSAETPTSWSWTFEGGSPSSSTSSSPQNIYYNNPGTYDVSLTVTNDFGSDTYTTQVTVSSNPEVSLVSNSPTCFGSNDGSISSSISSEDTYSVSWSNGASTENLNNISGGNYTIQVTTSNGCTANATETLAEPNAIDIVFDIENANCFGQNNGSVLANASGGSGGFDYSWSSGSSNSTINSLGAGNYVLTVTDNSGCTSQSTAVVSQPEELTANLSTADIGCTNLFGSATVNPEGGNGGYTVNWSNGQSGNIAGDLAEGIYSVSIADENGCTTVENFEISSTGSLSVEISSTPISCHNGNDGSITTTVSGGNGEYTYDWNGVYNTGNLNNLSSGYYSLEVSDSEGCTGEASVELDNPAEIQINLIGTNVSCYGQEDGSIFSSISGGTGNYDLNWSNGSIDSNISGLAPGDYNITVSDENGCIANSQINIDQPEAMELTLELLTNESCSGNDGSAASNISGGTPAYNYNWSNGSSNENLLNASSGVYTLNVTDLNGCQIEENITINYDCDEELPLTMLIESDCGRTGLYLDDFITCEEIEGAEAYQWKFINLDAGLQSEVYTLGSNNTCQLFTVSSIHYNLDLEVSVRILSSGIWSEYGETCQISTATQTPATVLSNEYCEAYYYDDGSELYANAVLGALEYMWKFESDTDEIILHTTTPLLYLDYSDGFEANTEYQLSIAVRVGPNWSEFGNSCSLYMEESVSVGQFANNDPLIIYPNPISENKISVQMGNLSSGLDVFNFELYNSAGQLIEKFNLPIGGGNSGAAVYEFNETLSTGLYIIRYRIGDSTMEQKLIVR